MGFVLYQLKDLFALDSVTSMSLYSYFIKNEFKYSNQESYEVELSLENIKALTDIGEKVWPLGWFQTLCVRSQIVEEINDRTSLKLEYDTIKKGRPIVGVRFKITSGHTEAVIPQSNENTQIYLDVDFDDNAIVKELGAKFDMTVRSWYIHASDPNYRQFSKWFKAGLFSNSQEANLIVNDIMFQMDFAVAGVSMNDFKKEMKYKLKNDPTFVQGNRERLNEIFGKEII